MEKYIKIPTSDGFEINWVLNWKEKSDKLIIFVHGLTGSMHEAHYYCAKEYFISRWYDVFRFNLYADGEKTRKLKNTSIKLHGKDIEKVLDYFENNYGVLNIAWHSLAWPSIVKVKNFPKNLEKIIFWDPAFDTSIGALKCREDWAKLIRSWSGKEVEIFSWMHKEFLENKHIENLQNLEYPKANMYIVFADWDKHKDNKPQTDAMWIESYIVEWANHGFTQEGKYEELFEKTLEFIEK